jgi:hypothetical protein
MLKYKILIQLFVLNCVFKCCVELCGDTIQAEVVLLCLLVSLYISLKMTAIGGRNM